MLPNSFTEIEQKKWKNVNILCIDALQSDEQMIPCGITDRTGGKSHVFADAFVPREGSLKSDGRNSSLVEAGCCEQNKDKKESGIEYTKWIGCERK